MLTTMTLIRTVASIVVAKTREVFQLTTGLPESDTTYCISLTKCCIDFPPQQRPAEVEVGLMHIPRR